MSRPEIHQTTKPFFIPKPSVELSTIITEPLLGSTKFEKQTATKANTTTLDTRPSVKQSPLNKLNIKRPQKNSVKPATKVPTTKASFQDRKTALPSTASKNQPAVTQNLASAAATLRKPPTQQNRALRNVRMAVVEGGNEMEDLKGQLKHQNDEIATLKEMLGELLRKNENERADVLKNVSASPSPAGIIQRASTDELSNTKLCQTDPVTVCCQRCRSELTLFERFYNRSTNDQTGIRSDRASRSAAQACVARFENELFSTFPIATTATQTGGFHDDELSTFKSKFVSRSQNPDEAAVRGDDFFEKMIGIAQKWEKTTRPGNGEENGDQCCIQQVSVMRRVSNKLIASPATKSHWAILMQEAKRNPDLEKRIDDLAMQYLTDSQLAEIAKNRRPLRSDYESDKYPHYAIEEPKARKAAICSRKQDKLPVEMSVCSRDYLKRHGLLADSMDRTENFEGPEYETRFTRHAAHQRPVHKDMPDYHGVLKERNKYNRSRNQMIDDANWSISSSSKFDHGYPSNRRCDCSESDLVDRSSPELYYT